MSVMRNIKRRNRFVAMLDVMGTKSLIGQKQDKRVFDLMESIRTIEKEYATNDYVRMSFYSDSIILYTIDNCEKSFSSILCTSAHIVKYFLKQGFGINGCISYGVCTCDYKDGKYITIGQPLFLVGIFSLISESRRNGQKSALYPLLLTIFMAFSSKNTP